MIPFLAVLPSVLLIAYTYRKDTIEKEPPSLLIRLFGWGALTVISAIVLGAVLEIVAEALVERDTMAWLILDNFLMTALVEEGGKYFVLKWRTWKSPHFDYIFDGIVYAVIVSLGFATVENILYLSDGDLSTAVMRAVFSVPGHAVNAVFMGSFYGLAKRFDLAGDARKCRAYLRRALWVPTLIHGFYDFCLSTGDAFFICVFFVFEIVVTVSAFRRVRKFSREDAPLV
ncbi:MAG: PrsW family intramembrane metalloprotease, partial [Oscillibacter sp.]|nr:PrsW family intramembrane metalloprotease [Oscillibacter sp.]